MLYMIEAGTSLLLDCVPFVTRKYNPPLTGSQVSNLLVNARWTRFSATDSLTDTQYLPSSIFPSPLIVLCFASELSCNSLQDVLSLTKKRLTEPEISVTHSILTFF